jgi:hypothetical protein
MMGRRIQMRQLTQIIALIVMGVFWGASNEASAANEQRCTELGANCVCSEPLNTNTWTQPTASYFNPAADNSLGTSLPAMRLRHVGPFASINTSRQISILLAITVVSPTATKSRSSFLDRFLRHDKAHGPSTGLKVGMAGTVARVDAALVLDQGIPAVRLMLTPTEGDGSGLNTLSATPPLVGPRPISLGS